MSECTVNVYKQKEKALFYKMVLVTFVCLLGLLYSYDMYYENMPYTAMLSGSVFLISFSYASLKIVALIRRRHDAVF